MELSPQAISRRPYFTKTQADFFSLLEEGQSIASLIESLLIEGETLTPSLRTQAEDQWQFLYYHQKNRIRNCRIEPLILKLGLSS